MRIFYSFIFVSCVCANLPAEQPSFRPVLASVAEVHLIPTKLGNDYVRIEFTIHSPDDLVGARFVIESDSKDKARMRREFPLGRLYVVSLPHHAVDPLLEQRPDRESIQRQTDSGIPPDMISTALVLPVIKISELPSPPIPFVATP
jgi:hypothetical protein